MPNLPQVWGFRSTFFQRLPWPYIFFYQICMIMLRKILNFASVTFCTSKCKLNWKKWATCKKVFNLPQPHQHVYPFFREVTPAPRFELTKICQDGYDRLWREQVKNNPKATCYVTFKRTVNYEKYLDQIENAKHNTSLSRFRLSNHNLMMEKGKKSAKVLQL